VDRATTALRRRSGLISRTQPAPTASEKSSARDERFSFLVESAVLSSRLASSRIASPALRRRLCHLDVAADLDVSPANSDQLLGGLELADDLLGCLAGLFHGGVPGPVWPYEDSQSPWTDP